MIAPYLREALEKRDMGEIITPFTNSVGRKINLHTGADYSATSAISGDTGVSNRKLAEVLKEDGFILFETADKILTGLNKSDAWYFDEDLALIYRLLGTDDPV